MDAWIGWHEGDGLVQNGHRFMVATFLEQTSAHVVVGQPNLYRHILLQPLGKHKFTRPLKIGKRLIVVFTLAIDRCPEKKQTRHVVEKVQSLGNIFHSHMLVTLKHKFDCFLVVLHCTWPLNGQKLNDLMVVGKDVMRTPEALISLVNAIHRPQQLTLQYEHLDIVWVNL